MIVITCPVCRGLLHADPDDVGSSVECEHCKFVFELSPTTVEKNLQATEPVADVNPAVGPVVASPTERRRDRTAATVGAIIAIIIILLLLLRQCGAKRGSRAEAERITVDTLTAPYQSPTASTSEQQSFTEPPVAETDVYTDPYADQTTEPDQGTVNSYDYQQPSSSHSWPTSSVPETGLVTEPGSKKDPSTSRQQDGNQMGTSPMLHSCGVLVYKTENSAEAHLMRSRINSVVGSAGYATGVLPNNPRNPTSFSIYVYGFDDVTDAARFKRNYSDRLRSSLQIDPSTSFPVVNDIR